MIRLTNSEMSQWMMCRRAWYLGTYRAFRPRGVSNVNRPLGIGTRVHDALEKYYQPAGAPRIDPLAWVEASYDADLEVAIGEAEDELLKEKALVVAMIEGYLQWVEETGVDQDIRVLAPETMVEVPLIEGATLLSKLDARVERISDGARLALEHKTVGDLKQPLALLPTDRQLLTEHLVEFLDLKARGLEDKRADGVLYNMLRKCKRTATAKPPFYDREDVPHNIHELRNHWRHCARIAKEIIETRAALDAGASHHDFCPPNPTRELSWKAGPFLRYYAMMNDGSDWEAAFAENFEVYDTLERYDGTTSYEV